MDHSDKIGELIGQYQLVRHLGGGSFGDVYLAEDEHTHLQVAVKLLQIKLSHKEQWREFLNEARLFRLVHPHIVQLLDLGITDEDLPFLVMEYAPHGTLRDRHPRGTHVPLPTVVGYVEAIASALFYAHERRLVHRDVKPENILLAANDRPLLSDFGIVTVAHSTHSIDATRVMGTPSYMAPEQLSGKPRPASDQYALGIMTYEWLTGTRPFSGTYFELISQHTITPPPPLREHLPTISPEVEQVVLTALAKDSKARFATVQAFALAFSQAASLVQSSGFIPPISLTTPPGPSTPKPFLPSIPQPSVPSITESSVRGTNPPQEPVWTEPVISYIAPFPSPLAPARASGGTEATSPVDTQTSALMRPLPVSTPPTPPRPSQHVPIRRNILLVYGILLALLVGSTSLLWTTIATHQAISTLTARTQVAATSQARASITTSINAYDHNIALNGIMEGFDAQHTRFNPFERLLSPTTVPSLKTAWSSDRTDTAIASSPAVANGMVYVGSWDGKLYAYKADGCGNGKSTCPPLWSSDPTGKYIFSSPAVANGVVYVGSDDDKLYAYKADGCGSGKSTCPPLWSSDPTGNGISSSPAVANGVVYVGSDDDKLYAYKADGCGSGKSTCPPLWSSDPTRGSIFSSPAVANGVVYVGSGDDKLYAYKTDGCGNGKSTCPPLWSSDPTRNGISSSPAVANGVVYVGSDDDKLYAYKADGCGSGKSTCPPLWSSDPTRSSIFSSPAVANGVVYVGSHDGKLYAYKADGCGNGKSTCPPLWSSDPTRNGISSSPAVANGVVYVGSDDDKLYAFHL